MVVFLMLTLQVLFQFVREQPGLGVLLLRVGWPMFMGLCLWLSGYWSWA